MLKLSVPEGLTLMQGVHAGTVHEELQPIGRTHVGEVSSCGSNPTLEQRKSVKSPPSEEGGVEETTPDELTASPVPIPLQPRRKR